MYNWEMGLQKGVWKYWQEILFAAWKKSLEALGWWGFFIPAAASFGATILWNRGEPLSKIFTGEWMLEIGLFVGFYIILLGFFVLREPVIIYNRKEEDIRLLKEKFAIKEYRDISLSFYNYPWTTQQLNLGVGAWNNFTKLGLRVQNKGGVKIHCALMLINLQYSGKGFTSNWNDSEEWIDAYQTLDMKYIKWDEGYDPREGKIDIAPDGGKGDLLFAETEPRHFGFWFWYVYGRGQDIWKLDGRYKATLRLEGDCEKNGDIVNLHPVEYEITFTYKHRALNGESIALTNRE